MSDLMKNSILKDLSLQPPALWKHFAALCDIPHPSGHEQGIIKYVENIASRHNLEIKKDHAGNLFIKKPATNEKHNGQTVMLQCHMDMVPQANSDKKHNFTTDPIVPIVDNGWIRADNTTLGADNGIAVAAALAILEDNTIEHGPLGILLTVEEESSMHGALEVTSDFFEADVMINLDSEDIDEIYIACAGAAGTTASLDIHYIPQKQDNYNFFDLQIKGLEGGHSGVDIILNRGNAIKILGKVLETVNKISPISLFELNGGSLWNAIPREASAKFAVSKDLDMICELRNISNILKKEYEKTDPDLAIEIIPIQPVDKVFDANCTDKAINAINIFPNGMFKMSNEIPGVVETSSNLGILKTEKDKLTLHSMQRSLIDSERDATQSNITEIMKQSGMELSYGTSFPGWVPDSNSKILEKCRKAYRELFAKDAKIMAIHAGLECGIIGKQKPEMEMIAIGPTIKFPHSPKEKVEIASVEKFWKLILQLIK
jgi:dipeptidase D